MPIRRVTGFLLDADGSLRSQLLRKALVGRLYLRTRRPGRRRSLRRGAAVLSCRRGENTVNSGPGHSRGVRTDLRMSFSVGLVTDAQTSGKRPPAACPLLSDRLDCESLLPSSCGRCGGPLMTNKCLPRSRYLTGIGGDATGTWTRVHRVIRVRDIPEAHSHSGVPITSRRGDRG